MLKKILLAVLNNPVLWISLAILPACSLYANRFLIPDIGTDVLSYHIFNGERAVQNPFVPFLPSEFYPVGIANVAPQYDLVQYGASSLLGYRLGTILSLLAVVGCVIILYKFLRLILDEQHKRFHAGWGLLLVSSAVVLEVYFQLATYMVDNLNAFFVLLVLYWLVRLVRRPAKQSPHLGLWIGLWAALGALLAVKITNAALVLPMIGVLAWYGLRLRSHLAPKRWAFYVLGAAAFLLPLLPGWIQNYQLTGNPVFPFYNTIFASPYYPELDFDDTTFGAKNPLEGVAWPLVSINDQIRLAEPHHIYNDYKMPLYWLCALVLALLVWRGWAALGRTGKIILFFFLASVLCNGLLFGINRYIIPSLLLGGLIIALMLAATYQKTGRGWRWLGVAIGVAVCVFLGIESFRIVQFNQKYDMSWRPTLRDNQALHRQQLAHLFDKKLTVTEEQQKTIASADMYLTCHTNVAGLLTLLPERRPVINIISDALPHYAAMADRPEYRQKALERLHTALPPKQTYRWVSVVSTDIGPTDVSCLRAIERRGGTIETSTPLDSMLGYKGIKLFLISGTLPL